LAALCTVSNGNPWPFDRFSRWTEETSMPRYFLKLTSETVSRMPNHPEPQEHANIEAARAEAVKGIREIAAEVISSGRFDLPFETIDITDEQGKLLVSVPVSEALGGTAR
jgi:hypothetical protein